MKSRVRSFFTRQEDGSITVEFVLWFPVIILIMSLLADSTMAFARQSHMWRVSTEVTRMHATGAFSSTSEAEAFGASLSQGRVGYTVSVNENNGMVTTTVSVPLSSSAILGFL